MSEAQTQDALPHDDPTAEDYRRVAQDLREKGMTILPDKMDRYADQLEDESDE